MAVIEEIESPRQIESVFRQERWLRANRRLGIRFFKTPGQHQQRPDFISRLAVENTGYVMVLIARQLMRFRARLRNDPVATALGADLLLVKLAKDRISSDSGVLAVRASLSLE